MHVANIVADPVHTKQDKPSIVGLSGACRSLDNLKLLPSWALVHDNAVGVPAARCLPGSSSDGEWRWIWALRWLIRAWGYGSTGLSGVECNRGNFALEHLPGTRWHEQVLTNNNHCDGLFVQDITQHRDSSFACRKTEFGADILKIPSTIQKSSVANGHVSN